MTDHTPLTGQQLDEIEARAAHLHEYGDPTDTRAAGWKMLAGEDVPALIADLRRARGQRRFLLDQIARKDARSGDGDRVLREFLAAADPICGDENDGDWCELEPGHDGNHRADTVEWAAGPAAPAAAGEGDER